MSIKENEGVLYELTLDAIIAKLKDPNCTAADINQARAFIKDHGIEGGKTMEHKENVLAFEIPEFDRRGEVENDEATGTDD